MSWLESLGFRTATPRFQDGETVNLVVTDYDEEGDEGIARVGDTVLRIEGVGPGDVNEQRTIKVTQFDEGTHTGRGQLASSL
jgi:hypothetical protein